MENLTLEDKTKKTFDNTNNGYENSFARLHRVYYFSN